MSDTPADRAPAADQTAEEISTAVVALLREYTGQQPAKARTTIDGDTIVVTLRDSLTRAERTLAAQGRAADVLAMRRAYQDAMRDDLVAVVERLTGRTVDAFLSDHLQDPDVAIEVFLMRPPPDDTPAHVDR